MMVSNSELMRNLMMDLLDLAQMEKSTFKLNENYFSLHDVIQKAFGVLGHIADRKQVQLVAPNAHIRESAYYNAVHGDEHRYLQIIINFLSNSLKFSDANSKILIHLRIIEDQTLCLNTLQYNNSFVLNLKGSVLGPEASGSSMHFSRSDPIVRQHLISTQSAEESTCYIKFELAIQDFGCGISADKLDSLFINFNNLEEHRKSNPSGRGLGLSICKLIVERMGGTVNVTSEVGKGTTFAIQFKVMVKVPQT